MKMAYVPCYNGKNVRNNIYYLDPSNIIFHVRYASLKTGVNAGFNGHNRDEH